jgi:hypothetical protein
MILIISLQDDFVATHINQTLTIHYTGNFLSWHRYFTWLYEQALQTECGYTGTQPVIVFCIVLFDLTLIVSVLGLGSDRADWPD